MRYLYRSKVSSLFLALVLTLGCGHKMMTLGNFYEVPLGTSFADLKKIAGTPYRTRKLEEGKIEYEYVERIPVNARVGEERHYFFVIERGQIVGKRYEVQSAPAYEYNSYELEQGALSKNQDHFD